MKRIIVAPALLAVAAAGLLAQNAASVFQQAPPAANEALRKRVAEFYQAHVEGKTMKVFDLIHADSKETFFNAQKPKLQSFEVQSVNYAKDFQSAVVLAVVEREVLIPFAQGPNGKTGAQIMKIPMESYWKQADGQWFWYVPKRDCVPTPFGCTPVDQKAPASGAMDAESIKKRIESIGKSGQMETVFGFKKATATLGEAREAEYTFENGMEGWVTLKTYQKFEDPEVELAAEEIQCKPNGETKIIVRLKNGVTVKQARDVRIPLVAQPFRRNIPIVVSLVPPPAKSAAAAVPTPAAKASTRKK